MVFYPDKAHFIAMGIEPLAPSGAHATQDCHICTQPLNLITCAVPPPPCCSSASSLPKQPHDAVRIASCGHIVGAECLYLWLDVSDSCPLCRRQLFESDTSGGSGKSGNGGSSTSKQVVEWDIRQEDAQAVVDALAPVYGGPATLAAMYRYLAKFGDENTTKYARRELARLHRSERRRGRRRAADVPHTAAAAVAVAAAAAAAETEAQVLADDGRWVPAGGRWMSADGNAMVNGNAQTVENMEMIENVETIENFVDEGDIEWMGEYGSEVEGEMEWTGGYGGENEGGMEWGDDEEYHEQFEGQHIEHNEDEVDISSNRAQNGSVQSH